MPKRCGPGDGHKLVMEREVLLKDSYLADFYKWDLDLGERFAAEFKGSDAIEEMTPEHWEVINFIRDYYEEYKIAPMIKIIVKAMVMKFGPQKGTFMYFYDLFPAGSAKQAYKIAGLPKPMSCSGCEGCEI